MTPVLTSFDRSILEALINLCDANPDGGRQTARNIVYRFTGGTTTAVTRRLVAMRRRGLVDSELKGARNLWWPTDAGREALAADGISLGDGERG